MYFLTLRTLQRKFRKWLKDQIAQDVPEADALCAYDCRREQCTKEEWATCERRIHQAAGELWPESRPQSAAQSSVYPDDINDISIHDEIKCRAYELYERRQATSDGQDLKDELRAELPRVAYAAAQLQKYYNGELVDTRTVRAACVYLRALSSLIGERDHGLSKQPSERRSNVTASQYGPDEIPDGLPRQMKRTA